MVLASGTARRRHPTPFRVNHAFSRSGSRAGRGSRNKPARRGTFDTVECECPSSPRLKPGKTDGEAG